jgi:cation diffusion facilitator CzcD-associated flavoprotein CzcO
MNACVIGAGVSGIAAAKALHEKGVPFDGFEKGSGVGGLWRYGNDNGLSGIYASLHTNTSKRLTEFTDFPMPDDYPDYPHHVQMLRYFEGYVDRFGFRDRFRFRTEVSRVERSADGAAWDVTLNGSERRRYDAVVVANGHHWDPRRPEFPGAFRGLRLHAHDYRTPEGFEGRRVLVVGIGNSAIDIACDLSGVASATFLSTRRGAYVFPKRLLGRPVDRWGAGPTSYLPLRVQGWLVGALIRLQEGALESYGLPRPAHRIDQAHPSVTDRLFGLLRAGKVQVRPDVKELCGERVRFVDGREEAVDAIVFATGYHVRLPFFPEGFVDPSGLYLNVVAPERPNLFFIGLIQPLQGPIPRTAQVQSEWVAGILKGEVRLPEPGVMAEQIERARAFRSRLVAVPRHSLEVNYYPYLRELRRVMKAGRTRNGGS